MSNKEVSHIFSDDASRFAHGILQNRPPGLTTPPISKISPSNKPALGRQRDHSACRTADTPLKVKKTRENLKQAGAFAEVPPPCLHVPYGYHEQQSGNESKEAVSVSNAKSSQAQLLPEQQQSLSSLHVQSKIQRQKSVSRRMLSRVKQGIVSKSKSTQSIRPTGSETSLVRRLSGRRKNSNEVDRRSQSFELSRDSIESTIDEVGGLRADTPPPVQRSFTESTVSTAEILEDLASVQVPSFRENSTLSAEPFLSTILSSSPAPATPSPQPTPRPLRKSITPAAVAPSNQRSLLIPYLSLEVTVDCGSVDVSSKRDVWVAIDTNVRLKTTTLSNLPCASDPNAPLERGQMLNAGTREGDSGNTPAHDCGVITSLRLCYKPAEGCRIRNIIGQKSYKDLAVGQQCTLFIKVGVPRIQTADDRVEPDQESLFAELESMVGTLKTDIMHVEARYRHSLFPSDNIVALKHTCKLLRPKTESRWSIIELYEKEDQAGNVHARLAQYLADHYAADEALELLYRYFDFETRAREGMAEVISTLQGTINLQRNGPDDHRPEVVITDIDLHASSMPDPAIEHYGTAPSTSLEPDTPSTGVAMAHKRIGSSTSLPLSKLALPIISAPRTTTTMSSTLASSSPRGTDGHESNDSAHQLWRHIRRTSLSARQLQEMTPERLSNLEAGDDSLKELRRRAIANKRSIGAETLRAWKWEEDMQTKEKPAEAPWM